MDASDSSPRTGEKASGSDFGKYQQEAAERLLKAQVDRIADIIHNLKDDDPETVAAEFREIAGELWALAELVEDDREGKR